MMPSWSKTVTSTKRCTTWSFAAVTGLIAAVAAIARFCQTGLAKWNALSGQAKSAAAESPGFLTTLAGWLRQCLLPCLRAFDGAPGFG